MWQLATHNIGDRHTWFQFNLLIKGQLVIRVLEYMWTYCCPCAMVSTLAAWHEGIGKDPRPIIHVLATFQERTDLLCTRNPLKPNHNRLFIFLDWKIAYFFSTKINKYHLFFIFLIINNFYYYNFIILSYF